MHMIQIAQAQYLWILALIPLLLAYGMYRGMENVCLKNSEIPN